MRFVVIEGLDGSGKSTQLSLLGKYLENESIPHRYLHFPRLEEGVYGKLIARFLRGEMGSLEEVDPYLVALIFAGDRADAAPKIREWMAKGDEGYSASGLRHAWFSSQRLSSDASVLRSWLANDDGAISLRCPQNAVVRHSCRDLR